MMKYVVDTSIINKLADGLIQPEELPDDGEFIASHIQIDELNNTKNTERRARLFLKFSKLVDQINPTESFALGTTRLGEGKLGDGETFMSLTLQLDTLNRGKPNNSMDALIAEIAINNGLTLLTSDYHLKQVTEAHGGRVRYWKT